MLGVRAHAVRAAVAVDRAAIEVDEVQPWLVGAQPEIGDPDHVARPQPVAVPRHLLLGDGDELAPAFADVAGKGRQHDLRGRSARQQRRARRGGERTGQDVAALHAFLIAGQV